jgi:hypothetical protein
MVNGKFTPNSDLSDKRTLDIGQSVTPKPT